MGNIDSKKEEMSPAADRNRKPQPEMSPPSYLDDSRVKPRYTIEQNLIYLQSGYNENYGDIKIMRFKDDSDQNLYALKVFRANDAKAMQAIYQEAEFRKDMVLDTVVKITDLRFDETNLYCSDNFKVLVLMEYFEQTLKDEILRRKQKNLYFSEIELFSLIDCVLSALILFDKKGIAHENVCPGAIFLTPAHIFKLNDIGFLTEGLNAYKKFLMGASSPQDCYLSPELFSNLRHRTLSPEGYDRQKSDVFSLGMTTLEAASLVSMKECYDFDEFKVKHEQVAFFLEENKGRFNPNFCELLRNMLEIDESKRPDYKDLFVLLGQELDQIKLNMENPNELVEEPPLSFERRPMGDEPPEVEREEKPVRAGVLSSLREDLESLEGRIMRVLSKSEETQRKCARDLESSRSALERDDIGELIAKREDFVSKSNLIKESLLREREKKSAMDDENYFDSNKLYEVYMEEYRKLKEKDLK